MISSREPCSPEKMSATTNMFNFSKAKAAHIKLGRRGEKIAQRFLRSKGIDILLCNYRNRRGEIDIIARDGKELCIVEVKTRRHTTRSRPEEGLSEKQLLRNSQAAELYLHEIGDPNIVYRFDLIEIIIGNLDVKELFYRQNYYSPSKNQKKYKRL